MNFEGLHDFELRQICYFMMLVEAENSFSEAASRVGIKQGAFSQRIKALEEKLSVGTIEVELFDRGTRPSTLTEAGRVFLKEAEFALTHLERAINQARRASQGEIGHLTVGVHNSVANSILPKVLRTFQSQYPDVELELREVTVHQEIALLKEHQLDLVFHRSPSPYENDSDLVFVPILQELFVVVLPETHALAKQKQVSLASLKKEPMILPSIDTLPFYKQVIRLCQKAGFEPKIIQTIKATGIVTLLSLVAAGIGVSILPSHVQVLHREGVVYRPLQDKMLGRHMTIVYRKADPSNVLQKFLDVTREVMELNPVTLN
ncbi:LysR substrate-binding domain-containing protein [Leptolyngbya sp. CCY15150]|uniref:LysR substrate-binding domain-containing protein n=1 Tax=Leptolyngbya sp. CCY15150 TaxID=2767772 RepID=UPI00194E06EA|nr:LysR substrate-binding domain-containing protein [Leptolyngbya sp. CCY15150]